MPSRALSNVLRQLRHRSHCRRIAAMILVEPRGIRPVSKGCDDVAEVPLHLHLQRSMLQCGYNRLPCQPNRNPLFRLKLTGTNSLLLHRSSCSRNRHSWWSWRHNNNFCLARALMKWFSQQQIFQTINNSPAVTSSSFLDFLAPENFTFLERRNFFNSGYCNRWATQVSTIMKPSSCIHTVQLPFGSS